ncbi:MAG: flippase-like domain-containing protein, partial [Candidatus Omnitrophica bacterium]|nr:flippase-like domain-containing protein [Candidatus Omnitrophota bacterium]
MKKSTIFQIIRAGVSLSLILLLLYIMRGKYAQIIESITRANLPLLIASLTVFLAAITLASLRLMLIIAAQGTPVTFIDSISLTFIGYFFNNFLPTAIGGDFVKGYYLSKRTGDRTGSYTAIFVDRAIGLFTMIFMAFIALLFAESGVIDKPLRNLIYIITAISAAFIFFMAHRSFARRFSFLLFLVRPIEEKLRNIYTAVNKYRHHKILMIQSLFISIISQLLYFVSLGIVAMSIGSFISISDVLLRMPIVSAISLLPSINGLGVREGSMVLLFGPIIGKTSAFAVSIVMLALLFAVS